MNILKIVFANIRKRKGASITFLVMVLLATLMLSISLSLMIGGANFYEKKIDELNAPHYSNFIIASSYKDGFEEFANDYAGVTDVAVLDCLIATGAWNMKSGVKDGTILLLDKSDVNAKSFQTNAVIDKEAAPSENGIVLPISFKTSGGFKSGEKITCDLSGKAYGFTISGFYEAALLGASTNGTTLAYLETEIFQELKADNYFTPYKNLSVRFDKTEKAAIFMSDFNKLSKLNSNEEFVTSVDYAKTGAMTFVNVMSMIMIVFSLIILLIAFIVVRFSIISTMQEDIATIGALKSIGYKTKALRASQLLQYLFVASVGGIIGSVLSLFSFGLLGNIIASTSGLLWISNSNLIPVLLSIITICSVTAAITYFITRKYKKITPINALRQGDSHHSFKRNAMPLEKYKMPLGIHLGVKRFFKSIKNNMTVLLVVSLLVFISSLVFTMSYNLNVDTTAMTQMVGLEMAEVWVQTDPDVDIEEVNTVINSHEEVERTLFSGGSACSIDGFDSNVSCTADFNAFIRSNVVKGKYPKLYNEIALGSIAARLSGKGIGDTVTVEINGISQIYYVVGLTQDMGNGGDYSNITTEAVLKHNPDYKPDTIYVYLNDGVNIVNYMETLKGLYGNKILMANTQKQLDSILSSLGDPFLAISIVMIAITVVIIGFVLFLLISTLIRKEKKEFGIMKAIGYKNRQLMLQILISMLPSLILGMVVGIALSFAITNPILSLALSSMGLVKTFFIIPPFPTVLIGFGIFGVSIVTTYLIASRIKKISPQKLIVEQ